MYRLHKRYNTVKNLEEFLNYKKKHLADELRDALIILEPDHKKQTESSP